MRCVRHLLMESTLNVAQLSMMITGLCRNFVMRDRKYDQRQTSRSARPQNPLHCRRACIWGPGFDSARENSPLRGRTTPHGRRSGPHVTRPPRASTLPPAYAIPTGLSPAWGPSPGVATYRGNPGLGYASPSDLFRTGPYSDLPRRISVPSWGRRRTPANGPTNHGPQSTVHDPRLLR